jgi:hypothetical protein
MNPLYHEAIERRLAVRLQEGPDKVTALARGGPPSRPRG